MAERERINHPSTSIPSSSTTDTAITPTTTVSSTTFRSAVEDPNDLITVTADFPYDHEIQLHLDKIKRAWPSCKYHLAYIIFHNFFLFFFLF